MAYLKEYGRTLIANGYNITPIKPGSKHPTLTNWTQRDSRTEIDTWLEGPMRDWGVGILTKYNPAIDVDCDDPDVVRQVFLAITEIVGKCSAYRIGRAPRVLLVFRTDEPFTKLRSAKYEDVLLNTEHQVEILCDGQQFAAFHIHPDTKKPYQWPSDNLGEVRSDNLIAFSQEQAARVVQAFEEIAQEQIRLGRWRPLATSTALANPVSAETWLLDHRNPKQRTDNDVTEALHLLNANDYDRWLQVGMALHHQYNGDEHGFEIWHEWSRQSDSYASESDCRYRWDRFTSDTRASTVTIGSLFHWADEARHEQAGNALTEIERIVGECDDFHDLLDGRCVRRIRVWLDLYPLYRDRVVDLVKRRARILTGSPVSIEVVRRALKPKGNTKPAGGEVLYPWCEDWRWLRDVDRFFNMNTKECITVQSFDRTFNRECEEGKTATYTATELARVESLAGARYLPGADPVFTFEDLPYANTYRAPVDVQAGPLTPADLKAREMFARHVQTLIPKANDRQVFIDFLTFIVQNPGKRINFALLLQGQEGDGKSFFTSLMAAILGSSNVKTVNGAALEEKYSDWAEGSQVCFFEEVKVHGVSGHEIMNRFKPFITNPVVSIRAMHRGVFNAPNVTSYILYTNYRDSLPLSKYDSRYYVIFSRWETPEMFDEWKAANPEFFDELFQCLENNAATLRQWFMTRDISPGFNAGHRAPAGSSKLEMAKLSRDETAQHIDDILSIRGGEVGKNEELLSSTWLLWNWNFDGSGLSKPGPRRLNTVLTRDGWVQVNFLTTEGTESNRIKIQGRPHSFWTKRAEMKGTQLDTYQLSVLLNDCYSGEQPI